MAAVDSTGQISTPAVEPQEPPAPDGAHIPAPPASVQLAAVHVLEVPEPKAGEHVDVQVAADEQLKFDFDIDKSQVTQTADGVEIITPDGGILLLVGMTMDEFLLALGTGELVTAAGGAQAGTGAANTGHFLTPFGLTGLLAALLDNGPIGATALLYGGPEPLTDPDDKKDGLLCLFTPNPDSVDFDSVTGAVGVVYAEHCFYFAKESDDEVWLPSNQTEADEILYDRNHGFFGDAGDDTIHGRTLADIVHGGSGNDSIEGGAIRIPCSATAATTRSTARRATTRCRATTARIRSRAATVMIRSPAAKGATRWLATTCRVRVRTRVTTRARTRTSSRRWTPPAARSAKAATR